MNINRTIKRIVLGCVFLLLSSLYIHAGFGVSPSNINSEFLKPGASFEQTFTLSRSGSLEEMTITIQLSLGEVASWFTYEPGNTFIFERGETTKTFKIRVDVPSNADYQKYDGVIRITAAPAQADVAGVSITQGVRLDALLVVTKEDFRDLSITSIKALDSVEGKPIRIEIGAENKGNVDASPTVKIKVMNLLMEVVEEHEIANFGFVKPNEKGTLVAEFTSKLPTGEYYIEVLVLLDGKELRKERLVFNITNIPSEDNQEDEEKPLFGQIGSIISDYKDVAFYTAIASTIVLTSYLLIGKMWELKGVSTMANKWWARLLGSTKYARLTLALFIGIQVLLIIILFPLVKEKSRYLAVEDGNVQGIQDNTKKGPTVNVIEGLENTGYIIYEEPDTSSKIVYTAQDGEKFSVTEEQGDWYKVLLQNNSYGWLQNSIVKSKLTEEK